MKTTARNFVRPVIEKDVPFPEPKSLKEKTGRGDGIWCGFLKTCAVGDSFKIECGQFGAVKMAAHRLNMRLLNTSLAEWNADRERIMRVWVYQVATYPT